MEYSRNFAPTQERQSINDQIFSVHSVLPVSKPDIDFGRYEGLIDPATREPGYAWERLPRWMTEVYDAIDSVDTDEILILDPFSSVAIFAQTMRCGQFKRAGERASQIGRNIYAETGREKPGNIDESIFNDALSYISGNKPMRGLLAAVTQEAIYAMTRDEYRDENVMRDRLRYLLENRTEVFEIKDGVDKMEESWRYKVEPTELGKTFAQMMSEVLVRTDAALEASSKLRGNPKDKGDLIGIANKREPLNPDGVDVLIDWHIDEIIKHLSNKKRYKPCRIMSIDAAKPDDIVASSLLCMPRKIIESNLFAQAVASMYNPDEHLQADVFGDIDVDLGSVTAITVIDGWPLGDSLDEVPDDDETNKAMVDIGTSRILKWNSYLATKGSLTIFPWNINGPPARTNTLLQLVEAAVSDATNGGVQSTTWGMKALENRMSPEDVTIAREQSSVFSGKQPIRLLQYVKPNPKKQPISKLDSRTQSLPNPTL